MTNDLLAATTARFTRDRDGRFRSMQLLDKFSHRAIVSFSGMDRAMKASTSSRPPRLAAAAPCCSHRRAARLSACFAATAHSLAPRSPFAPHRSHWPRQCHPGAAAPTPLILQVQRLRARRSRGRYVPRHLPRGQRPRSHITHHVGRLRPALSRSAPTCPAGSCRGEDALLVRSARVRRSFPACPSIVVVVVHCLTSCPCTGRAGDAAHPVTTRSRSTASYSARILALPNPRAPRRCISS